jgi:hypothetical protein
MANSARNSDVTKALSETGLAFVAGLLILPLAFKLLKGIFSLSIFRKLMAEMVFVGLTALLTNEAVLDKLFGARGRRGDGVLKPSTRR